MIEVVCTPSRCSTAIMPTMMTTTRTTCTAKLRTVGSCRNPRTRDRVLRAALDAHFAANRVAMKIRMAMVRLIAKSPAISVNLATMAASTATAWRPAATASAMGLAVLDIGRV